jgi:hypothetical protein
LILGEPDPDDFLEMARALDRSSGRLFMQHIQDLWHCDPTPKEQWAGFALTGTKFTGFPSIGSAGVVATQGNNPIHNVMITSIM